MATYQYEYVINIEMETSKSDIYCYRAFNMAPFICTTTDNNYDSQARIKICRVKILDFKLPVAVSSAQLANIMAIQIVSPSLNFAHGNKTSSRQSPQILASFDISQLRIVHCGDYKNILYNATRAEHDNYIFDLAPLPSLIFNFTYFDQNGAQQELPLFAKSKLSMSIKFSRLI